MDGLKVTVIIPAYRATATIGRALDSVLAQTTRPDEILIVDDGSPEDLATAVRPYAAHVRMIRKRNGGAGSARNLGIEQSRGNLLSFLDADDYWEPSKLEKQIDVMVRYPQVDLVASRYYLQHPLQPRFELPAEHTPPLDRVLRLGGEGLFDLATLIWTSTVLVRRGALGDHRFREDLRTAEDRDLWVRIASAGGVFVLPEFLATKVEEPNSLTRASSDLDVPNMLQVVREHAGLLGRGGLRRWHAREYRVWAAGRVADGRPGAALVPACKRLRYEPFSLRGWWMLAKCMALACGGVAARSLSREPVER